MKSRSDNGRHVIPGAFPVILLVLLSGVSCHRDKEKGLIPEKVFESIITEIHYTDGLLMIADIREKYYARDSVSNYIDVVENHGYTKEAMDKTLRYYFTEKPKKLIKIYDRAIGKLTEIETILAGESVEIESKGGLWKGLLDYNLFSLPESEKIYFDHVCYVTGEYKLIFSVTVHPSDATCNPCFTAWYSASDSAETGKRYFLPSIRYLKDGRPHTYTFTFSFMGKSPVILKGWLYDSENNPSGVVRHAAIENISFLLTPGII